MIPRRSWVWNTRVSRAPVGRLLSRRWLSVATPLWSTPRCTSSVRRWWRTDEAKMQKLHARVAASLTLAEGEWAPWYLWNGILRQPSSSSSSVKRRKRTTKRTCSCPRFWRGRSRAAVL